MSQKRDRPNTSTNSPFRKLWISDLVSTSPLATSNIRLQLPNVTNIGPTARGDAAVAQNAPAAGGDTAEVVEVLPVDQVRSQPQKVYGLEKANAIR